MGCFKRIVLPREYLAEICDYTAKIYLPSEYTDVKAYTRVSLKDLRDRRDAVITITINKDYAYDIIKTNGETIESRITVNGDEIIHAFRKVCL